MGFSFHTFLVRKTNIFLQKLARMLRSFKICRHYFACFTSYIDNLWNLSTRWAECKRGYLSALLYVSALVLCFDHCKCPPAASSKCFWFLSGLLDELRCWLRKMVYLGNISSPINLVSCVGLLLENSKNYPTNRQTHRHVLRNVHAWTHKNESYIGLFWRLSIKM